MRAPNHGTVAVALAMTVSVSIVRGPFVHAHVGEGHGGHDADHAAAVHAHITGHPAAPGSEAARGHAAAGAPAGHDELIAPAADRLDAVYLPVFVAVEAARVEMPATMAPVARMPMAGVRSPHRPVLVTHGHDPPPAAPCRIRPPPPLPVQS